MPTYDYECAKCGHRFDAFQSMSEDPLRKCPSCGKAGLRRLIGGGLGVIFKGSGFYQTDYRSQGYHEAAKKDKPASGTDGDKKAKRADKPKAKTSSSSSSSKSTKKD